MLSRYIIEQEEIESMRNADTLWKLIEILRPTLLTRDKRRVVAISQGVDALVHERVLNRIQVHSLGNFSAQCNTH